MSKEINSVRYAISDKDPVQVRKKKIIRANSAVMFTRYWYILPGTRGGTAVLHQICW